MSYATTAELRFHLSIPEPDVPETDPEEAPLQRALDAASSMVDRYCKRTFVVPAEEDTATARIYTADRQKGILYVDDIADDGVTVKQYDGTAYTDALTDFTLEPINAAAKSEAWDQLYSESWVTTRNGVEVTAKWGWPEVPEAVKQGTLIQAARIFSRKNSPYGIAGSPETGSELRLLAKLDPDVEQLLTGYRRLIVQ